MKFNVGDKVRCVKFDKLPTEEGPYRSLAKHRSLVLVVREIDNEMCRVHSDLIGTISLYKDEMALLPSVSDVSLPAVLVFRTPSGEVLYV